MTHKRLNPGKEISLILLYMMLLGFFKMYPLNIFNHSVGRVNVFVRLERKITFSVSHISHFYFLYHIWAKFCFVTQSNPVQCLLVWDQPLPIDLNAPFMRFNDANWDYSLKYLQHLNAVQFLTYNSWWFVTQNTSRMVGNRNSQKILGWWLEKSTIHWGLLLADFNYQINKQCKDQNSWRALY